MALYLVRHGQTEWNRDGRAQGWKDSPLTPLGCDQARQIGVALRRAIGGAAPALVASPLGRTVATLGLICAAAGWDVDAARLEPDLREIGLGEFEGLTGADMAALGHPPPRYGGPAEWMFHCPGGESWTDITFRLDRALSRLPADGDVVLVSHSVAGKLMRGRLTGLDRAATLALDHPQDAFYRIADGAAVRIAAVL